MTKSDASLQAHLRAIRTAVAGVALAILVAGANDIGSLGFWLLVVTVLVIAYSFVPTVLNS